MSNLSIELPDGNNLDMEYFNRIFNGGYNQALDDCIEIVKNNYRMEALNKLEKLRK